MKQHKLRHALPSDLVFPGRCREVGLRLRMTRVETVLGVFEPITLPFALPDLKPVVEGFLEPQARGDEEQPC